MDSQSQQLPSYNRAAVSQYFSILFLGEGCNDQSFGGPGKARQKRETVETGSAWRAEERCDKEESLQGIQPISGAGILRGSPYADTCFQAGSDQALAALSSQPFQSLHRKVRVSSLINNDAPSSFPVSAQSPKQLFGEPSTEVNLTIKFPAASEKQFFRA